MVRGPASAWYEAERAAIEAEAILRVLDSLALAVEELPGIATGTTKAVRAHGWSEANMGIGHLFTPDGDSEVRKSVVQRLIQAERDRMKP